MITNPYIKHVEHYINENTPLEFQLTENKYNDIAKELEHLKINSKNKDIISAMYSLFYTSLNYHYLASKNEINRPYTILIGDYISSYIVEILYKNKMDELLKIFSSESKKLLLNILNLSNEDHLKDEIICFLKKKGD